MMSSVALKFTVNVVETESLICQHILCFLPLVFSEDDFHSYSHHEILLTSFPLALEWTDFDPGEPDKKG